jgi:hypoxanthine phosphoribosyltransferase
LRGQLIIAEHMTMTAQRLGDRLLLVDDLVDSGHTLATVFKELPQRFSHIGAIRTAVVWYKACSVFKPDYTSRICLTVGDPPAIRGVRHTASGGAEGKGGLNRAVPAA